jgi:hypothetical protein|tara:strand:- start:540 stop:779 length:240 start_codon:yes stop_codon:yes gene_type:complete
MPVTSKVGRVKRHSDHVAKSGRKITVTSGAKVSLRRLIRLNPPYLESLLGLQIKHISSYPKRPQTTSVVATRTAATTNT